MDEQIDKKRKILILGAQGMLGTDLVKIFQNYNLTAWDKAELDITQANEVKQKITELKPEIIINATGYTNVDGAESNQNLANLINGQAIEYLTQACADNDILFIHISTDYVFNGQNSQGYKEEDLPDPINFYGHSKWLGEQAVLNQKNLNYYLIRTSWLYGRHGKNFIDTILRLGKERDELKVINDQFGKPTYTLDLAQKIKEMIQQNLDKGIYHITNQTSERGISWYELAKTALAISNIDVKIQPCLTHEYPLPAPRPHYSMLINTKLEPMRNWQEALKDYLNNK
ncbi:MAG: dTDP-4-dehydrorhamnose reductase [Patescibacteria group bacterium]|jgi:dTDP-4-dehydrorhamnose reductase|nr:dTDP-4-dehydrorhamnose reductase [Patescibacteria group bacterium]